jgi:PAS domain S-box-containing protein
VRTAARAYLVIGLLGLAAYVAVGGSDLLYEAYGHAAWIAIAVGVLRNRPECRAGWWLVAVTMALFGTADAVYFSGYSGGAPFPSVADALYMAGDVTFGAGVLALAGGTIRRDALTLADSAVLSLALGLFLWSAFFTGALGDGHGLARVVSIAYPVLDLLMLTVLVRVLLANGRKTASYYLLGASMLLLVLSDAWYVVPAMTENYVAGTWRDAGWLASYVLAGTAALHPSMRSFVARRYEVIPVRRVVLLGSSLVLVALAAILQKAFQGEVDLYAFAGFGGVMAAFSTVRVVGLVRILESTRRKAEESERRFRMVFEHSPIGISVGRDGLMMETNPALQRMLGYSGAELSQRHYSEVTHPDDRRLTEQAELDGGERDAFSIDKRYVRKDGATVDTHVNVALDVLDGFGISLIEDVTARRGLEEQLRQAQKLEAVGKLAGGVAHDFNNLMTAVIGYSDMLRRSLDGDPRCTKVDAIRESAVRAADLTRQLLAFGRRQVLQTDDLDLRDVVSRLEALLRSVIGEDVRLETLFGAEPVVVRADGTQLEQVVMNLAVNARDAMPRGGTLTLAVLSDGTDAILTVSDTGDGMDEATRRRIFEPFFTTKPFAKSSGLGLSTAHGIVGQSGGTIEVETEPGAGTVFTVRLPLAGDDAMLPVAAGVATMID